MQINIHSQPLNEEQKKEVVKLLGLLGSENGREREKARLSLIRFGKAATPYLIDGLASKNRHVRWEIAKAFGVIKDPLAASALVETLNDEDHTISWLAAEALIAIDSQSIVPVLQGLITHFGSPLFRQSAHHVLHSFERTGALDENTLKVLDALRSIEPEMTAPFLAQKALERLK